MKEQPYGYLEDMVLLERTDFDTFEFRVSVSRYLSVEAEGSLHVTMKAKVSSAPPIVGSRIGA
jgi:hypothetical protein